jgi:hypothetical protein
MAPSLLQRSQFVYAQRIGGYHNECEVEGEWVGAGARFAPGRSFLVCSEAGAKGVAACRDIDDEVE